MFIEFNFSKIQIQWLMCCVNVCGFVYVYINPFFVAVTVDVSNCGAKFVAVAM